MNKTIDKETIDNSFSKTLGEIRFGESLAELSKGLAELVAKVRDRHLPGTITYKIKVRPASKGSAEALILEDEIKVTLPKEERAASFFFATEENLLQRDNPLQANLDLKVVAAQSEPIRKVS